MSAPNERRDPFLEDEHRARINPDNVVQMFARETKKRGAPLRSKILELNQSLRGAQEQMGHLDCGSLTMRIPEGDFYILLRRFPELNSTDPETNKRAWEWLERQPFAEKYRIRRNDGKRLGVTGLGRGARGY